MQEPTNSLTTVPSPPLPGPPCRIATWPEGSPRPTDPPSGAKPTYRRPPALLDPQVLRDAGVRVGERVRVAADVVIDRPDMLELYDDVQIGPGVRLICEGGLTIRERTIVSAGAQLLSATPSIPRRGRRVSEAAPARGQIEIHQDVWIGHNAIVLPKTVIESHVVVQPGTVVEKHVGNMKAVIGNPARFDHNRQLY